MDCAASFFFLFSSFCAFFAARRLVLGLSPRLGLLLRLQNALLERLLRRLLLHAVVPALDAPTCAFMNVAARCFAGSFHAPRRCPRPGGTSGGSLPQSVHLVLVHHLVILHAPVRLDLAARLRDSFARANERKSAPDSNFSCAGTQGSSVMTTGIANDGRVATTHRREREAMRETRKAAASFRRPRHRRRKFQVRRLPVSRQVRSRGTDRTLLSEGGQGGHAKDGWGNRVLVFTDWLPIRKNIFFANLQARMGVPVRRFSARAFVGGRIRLLGARTSTPRRGTDAFGPASAARLAAAARRVTRDVRSGHRSRGARGAPRGDVRGARASGPRRRPGRRRPRRSRRPRAGPAVERDGDDGVDASGGRFGFERGGVRGRPARPRRARAHRARLRR